MKQLRHIFFSLFFMMTLQADPLLVVVLMVKNEEPSMEMTLQPLIDAGIKDYLIYDTGSTDNTIQITRQIFEKNNISNYVIEEGEFVDFSTSRNKALALTEQHFPEAIFMLMLDAEWILHDGWALLDFCLEHKNNHEITLCSLRMKNKYVDFSHSRLIRCKSGVQFVGRVHEVPDIVPQRQVSSDVYIELGITDYGQKKSKARLMRDIEILLEDFQANPDEPKFVYYIAQSYFCMQDWSNAAIWFTKRARMQGFEEERFLAIYYLAFVYQKLGNLDKMIEIYNIAFEFRPSRAEPLIRLAEYYYSIKNYHLAYKYARQACFIPYPNGKECFVEQWLYQYNRFALLAVTAHHCNDYYLGLRATIKVLEVTPDSEDFQKILSWYQK